MEMTKMILAAAMTLGLATSAFAHDEGHGPKISDSGKYGGIVSSVVSKAEAEKGAHAAAMNKAELVRSGDGTARLYVYDTKMKLADLKGFDAKATGTVWSGGKGKKAKSEFTLEQKDGAFVGTLPKDAKAPYTLEVTLKKSGTDLLTAFANLD
jgi:hypothetical protein